MQYNDELCDIDHVVDDQQFVSIVRTSVGEDRRIIQNFLLASLAIFYFNCCLTINRFLFVFVIVLDLRKYHLEFMNQFVTWKVNFLK